MYLGMEKSSNLDLPKLDAYNFLFAMEIDPKFSAQLGEKFESRNNFDCSGKLFQI